MTPLSFDHSTRIFESGKDYIPLGVNSPGRAFGEVDTPALVIESAQGARIRDADGNEYVDFIMGLGPCLLGHNPTPVVEAIRTQADLGLVYGINSTLETKLAKRLIDAVETIEKVRFTCSGTEAVMSALRVARAHTQRPALLKFQGGYHGHSDIALSKASKKSIRDNAHKVRSGLHTFIDENTFVVDYNDTAAVRKVFAQHADQLAAVIMEPIGSNMGLVRPRPEFLKTIRELCDHYGVLLIFDEVVTGFRFRYGSVAELLGVKPDMVTFGKVIGGGLPVGAYGASEEIMKQVGSTGSVFQGGTFAGSPLTMAAGIAAFDMFSKPDFYTDLNQKADRFVEVTREGFAREGIPFSIDQFGALASYIFNEKRNHNSCFSDVEEQDYDLFRMFHTQLVHRGFLFPPTIEEPIFFSSAHTMQDVEQAASEAVNVIAELLNQRKKSHPTNLLNQSAG